MSTTITIDSIFGGKASSALFLAQSQYLDAVGIDPDLPISDAAGDVLISGLIRPSAYAKFSSGSLTGNPLWIETNPKNALVYVLTSTGKFISYDSALGSETVISTIASCTGNGMVYYNNYIYIFRGTDVDRYGPLDGSPSYTSAWWTSTISLAALTDTTYPSLRGSGLYPNHAPYSHKDGALYFLDYINGKGMVHKIKTSKTTSEGDTNNGSAYAALDLPFGYIPMCIAGFGNYVAIGCSQTTNATLLQGKSAIFLWDTISDSYYDVVEVPDALLTAMKNVNGYMYALSGSVSGGFRLSYYAGGSNIQTLFLSPDGSPAPAGAIDAIGDKVIFGSYQILRTTTAASPEYYPSVLGYKSKDPRVASGMHSIAKAPVDGSSTDGIVTAVKSILQSSFASPQLVFGYRNASEVGLAKKTTTYGTSIFRFVVNVGKPWSVKSIHIPLATQLAANMGVEVRIFKENFQSVSQLKTINTTNFPNAKYSIDIDEFVQGETNFVLELRNTGTVLCVPSLPITVDVEIRGRNAF